MKTTTIDKNIARKIALHASGLGQQFADPLASIRHLGYVQIDTISVIQRAHHHTFWNRCQLYTPKDLDRMQRDDRSVFEYWWHAAAYLPMEDFRYSLRRKNAAGAGGWKSEYLKDNKTQVDRIKERIRKEGPLGSIDFKNPEESKGGGTWWNWKPAKVILDALFHSGELMVAYRKNFQRYYDFPENIVPDSIDTSSPTDEEYWRHIVKRIIQGLGITAFRQFWLREKRNLKQAIQEQIEAGILTPVELPYTHANGDQKKRIYYAETRLLEHYASSSSTLDNAVINGIKLLSPFDNFVIWRERIKEIFNFDYTIECYVPAKKRIYGYFCLPVLNGTEFTGRIDCKADRPNKTLIIRDLHFEKSAKDPDQQWGDLARAILEFAAFNECIKINVEKTSPRKYRRELNKAIRENH